MSHRIHCAVVSTQDLHIFHTVTIYSAGSLSYNNNRDGSPRLNGDVDITQQMLLAIVAAQFFN